MENRRITRINNVLRKVIYDTIIKDVDDPVVKAHVTIVRIKTSNDIMHSKVYISIMANTEDEQKKIFNSLVKATKFIAVNASKKVPRMKYFPNLTFILDQSIDYLHRITDKIDEIC